MWSSISKIEIPNSLQEVLSLCDDEQGVLFSGGTYLVSKQNPTIKTLIDINHLITSSINRHSAVTKIGAKASLQDLIDHFSTGEDSHISQCAKWSCPSKNIRNQRTLGGEIAQRRVDSELYIYLYTLNVSLSVFSNNLHEVKIREWDGSGIITKIEINNEYVYESALIRFALIPSAPAFVIVAGVRRKDQIDLTIGGKANQLTCSSIAADEYTDEYISDLSASAVNQFHSDIYGSINYKQKIIQTGLKRIRAEL